MKDNRQKVIDSLKEEKIKGEIKMKPIPRLNDVVERVDFKRMFGRVIKIIDKKHLKIRWADKEKPYEKIESINKLALIERRK